MYCVFREHLLRLWLGFNGAAAQHPKMENGERGKENGMKIMNYELWIMKKNFTLN
jgi:hypothetical protein